MTCEEVDPNFFLYYHDIRLGVPSFDAEMCTFKTTPQVWGWGVGFGFDG